MKLTTKLLCCLVLLATVTCWTQAGSNSFARSIDKSQTDDHGGKIDSRYDGFSHETVVTLNKMRITCRGVKGNFKDACISFVTALHCPGIQLDYVRYVNLQLIFQTQEWDQRHPLNERQLSVVADGETLRLGQMRLVGQSVDTLMTETLEVEMPYPIFTKIVRAQVVQMKVGNSEFELRPQNLAALRDLNNRVKF
ncbi:MAG TPA: hypothetical protein VIF64_23370 [Pyrinomonadaceae bacterium]|jgi:hypothetical protein